MSISASMDFKIINNNCEQLKFIGLIKCLRDYGWSLNDNGQMSYLPYRDKDEYNWTSEEIDELKINSIIALKQTSAEVVGITLTWKDTGIGGELLIYDSSNFSFCISINRKTVVIENDTISTDFNWYLERFVTPLKKNQFKVLSINCSENI